MSRQRKNRNHLSGRAGRIAIEQEELEVAQKRWARRKETVARYADRGAA